MKSGCWITKVLWGSLLACAVLGASGCRAVDCRRPMPIESHAAKPPMPEAPFPRFHPVPAWDVFRPPGQATGEVCPPAGSDQQASGRPFFLAPSPETPARRLSRVPQYSAPSAALPRPLPLH